MGMQRAFWGRLLNNFRYFWKHVGDSWGGLGRHLGPLLGMQNWNKILGRFLGQGWMGLGGMRDAPQA